MKRMVKNGDLIDVEPDGSITVAGKPIGGGGGSDYTAGSNIEISDSKVISVKSDITGFSSVDDKYTDGVKIISSNKGALKIQTKWSGSIYPRIQLLSRNATDNKGYVSLGLIANSNYKQFIEFDCYDYGENTAYAFMTRGSKVPQVPTGDGTYVLKATVSGNNVTYEWVVG